MSATIARNGLLPWPFLLLFLLAPLTAQSPAPAETFRDFDHDAAWCWFAGPRSIRVAGEGVYAGWVDSRGDIMVGRWPQDGGRVECQVVAKGFEKDDHASPSLHLRTDGRLMVFFSRHADTGLRLRVMKRPGDLHSWGEERRFALNDPDELRAGYPNAACYPNPIGLGGRRLALLWRGTNWKPCISFSDDEGESWSLGRVLVSAPNAAKNNRPYTKVFPARDGGFHLAFTTGHPRNEKLNSVFYLRFREGAFFRADGSGIAEIADLPIDPASCDRIYDAHRTGIRAWLWDIVEDSEGRPVVAYTRLPAESRHVYHVARFDGKDWRDEPVVDAGPWFPKTPEGKKEPEPHYSGGIALAASDPRVVYLSRPHLGVFEIEQWRRSPRGTWSGRALTRNSQADNVRPEIVRSVEPGGRVHRERGAHGPRVLWMHLNRGYIHYTRYGGAIKADVAAEPIEEAPLTPTSILAIMERVGAWQIEHPLPHSETDWTRGALYAGLDALAQVSPNPRFEEDLVARGREAKWDLGPRKSFADDACVGQTWISLALRRQDARPEWIAPTRQVFDDRIRADKDESLEWKNNVHLHQWAWCDALFMAPPTLALLAEATRDARYLDLLDKRWWRTSRYLYDAKEHLYYRDSRYFEKKEANGESVFWSRGNGWVMAGLARVLAHMPTDRPSRGRYERQFREMAARILSLQQADGSWHASLLDPSSFPNPEMSGTGFFCFALAWGCNAGLLPRETYRPAAQRAWQALCRAVDANGRLGWVQPIGADPRSVRPFDTEIYGVGAFLLAGRELMNLN
ncbi:MAG TPA: hypothetical protein ENK43_17975 [Planctomycetes bacterium]|nr:hypothetical protein [Planctomycetota bacterium]